ncbi:amidohydrolase [Leucobacter sp. M11]|uniref:amidohydrolase n=1 Tax=Leucobacter sp. M11 TaxID=2993565 RepID=UPI002D7F43E0|nr:amidohydrolase [Leucobacter sp. M11]MEB4615688.1 amidohydrolase [Leucobacter sp. M11]
MRVDSIWHGGAFWTGNPEQPEADALAVWRGRIVAVGDVSGLSAPVTVDLGGARVVPGFHDAHHHLAFTGARLASLNLRPHLVRTLDELYAAVEAFARDLPADAIVRASGYDQNALGSHPTAAGLDRVTGGRAAILDHVSGHMLVANTAAFALAGFPNRRGVPEFPGGRVARDAEGVAEGLLEETAMNPLQEATATVTPDEIRHRLALAAAQAASYGITSVTEPGVIASGSLATPGVDLFYYQQALRAGQQLPRLTVMPLHHALHGGERFPEGWRTLDWGLHTGFGDDRLRLGPVKIISDGSLIGTSAAMHECYCGQPDNTGVMQLSPEDLHEAVLAFHRAGWSIATHAIGDRAIDHVLDAFDAAQREDPRPTRHRIEHFAVASDAQVARAAALGIIPVPQGVFLSDFGDGILRALGADRAAGTYRMRSLLDAGMIVPGSSDSPVSDANPLVSMHDLVNRRTASGVPFAPEERVTVTEALSAYTHGSAYAAGVEADRGRLMPGMLADFAVLSEDVLAVEPERIREVRVLRTVQDGRTVFHAEAGA